MSKRKIWSDFNRLECGKTEKIFAGTWSFNKRVEISSSVERMVLQGGSKLEENETSDADTFIIHYTAVCLHRTTIPYIRGTSETIASILQPYNIRVAQKPITTLR